MMLFFHPNSLLALLTLKQIIEAINVMLPQKNAPTLKWYSSKL